MERNLVFQRNCPINWDFNKCSSNEHVDNCRSCCNYNPLKILLNNDIKSSLNISRSILYQDLMKIEKSNIHEFDFAKNYVIEKYFESLGKYLE